VDKKFEDALLGLALLIARHWLLALTLLVSLFVMPIVLTPFLMSTGDPVLLKIGELLMFAYKPTCHQLPERSFFIFGHQMTVCSRCFAIYAAFLAGCIVFPLVRTRLKIWDIKYFVLLCVPLGIDGVAQLFGVALPRAIGAGWQLIWTVESTNEIRAVTGAIFGLAGALYVLPYLQEIFSSEASYSPVKSAENTAPPDKKK
jgi:uncharacterized membrane protein